MIPEVIALAMSLVTPKVKEYKPSIGQFIQKGSPINELSISRVSFGGDCPGEKILPANNIAFLEKTTDINLGLDKYRRIKVENMNTGGFTDRKYKDKGFSSQLFNITLGTKHRGSYLTVQEGLNRFKWSVFSKKTKEIFVSGYSSLIIKINNFEENRSFRNIREDIRCYGGERIYSYYTQEKKDKILSNCPKGIYVIETKGICPGGAEITLTSEKIIPGRNKNKKQIIQNFY